MGIFNFFSKEIYINKLVRFFKSIYLCGDKAAIVCLRTGYSKQELELILNKLILAEKNGELNFYRTIFKESFEKVENIDKQYNHD